ncbi:serine/threonine-protein kinase [Nonomuraea longicatena]|uniref:Protein kinase domain-containing protein n=1 Tax=Nonomuraea longicatena TaxID=83682 RepID=A0ABP3ZNL6_9ACTN
MPQIAPLVAGDPDQLGSFRLTGRIGEGGQGIVYLGVNEQGERAAIKLLHVKFTGDTIARSRFGRELRAAQRVASFCTARVMEADLDGNTPYIASEYIDGLSLRDVVETEGPITGTPLDRLAIGTATALTAIHHASIVHRDFKPDNVLIAADGPRVVDFGIARIVDSTGTITSRAIGTPAYMAPEQIAGDEVGPFTDVFAWGATIAFAATGETVFEGKSIAVVLNRILNHEVDVSSMPEPLRGVVASALSKDAKSRPTADQLLLRLLGQPDSAGASAAVLSKGAEVAGDDTTPFGRVNAGMAGGGPAGRPETGARPVPQQTVPPAAQLPIQFPAQPLAASPVLPAELSVPSPDVPAPPPEAAPAPKRTGGRRRAVIVLAVALVGVLLLVALVNNWPQRIVDSLAGGASGSQGPPGYTSVVDRVASTGAITIGIRGDLPGIGLERGDGTFEGLDAELGRRIATALGARQIDFVFVSRGKRAEALAEEQVDMVLASYSIDKSEVQFAGPYYVAHHDVLVRQGGGIDSMDDLRGKRLCAPDNSSVGMVQERVDVKLVSASNYAICMDRLKSGQVDAVPGEDLLLAGFAQREKNFRFKLLGARLDNTRWAVGLKLGDAKTCTAINGIIADLYQKGTMAQLLGKYFGRVEFTPESKAPAMEDCR